MVTWAGRPRHQPTSSSSSSRRRRRQRQSLSSVKTKAGSGRRQEQRTNFSCQPQHAYVTGRDCAAVPEGHVWKPPCGCANHMGPGPRPGLHATWDCPLCFIEKHGRCPGSLASGRRDPAQWLAGDILTRAAKDD